MTEEGKQKLRDLKDSVSEWLHDAAIGGFGDYRLILDKTDSRLLEYAYSVALHADDHNLYELLSLRRFFLMLDRYKWRRKKVQKRIRLLEMVKFSGPNGRESFRLTPVQVFIVAYIYGLYLDNGRRLVRDAYIEVPRKFGKTTFTAGLAAGELMMFGEDNAQIYVGANSYNQAKICFDEIRNIVRGCDPTETHFRVNREKIMFLNGARNAFAQCLAANPKTLDGLNASLVILDEYAQARTADLKNVLTSSMGVRENPLTIVITTASDQLDGPYAHELEGVQSVLRGEIDNDRIFALIFQPDVDDYEGDPHTWEKVQPHLGVTVQPDYYEIEWQRAQLSTENMMTFRTKLLNIFSIDEQRPWISPRDAMALLSDYDADNVTERPLTACAFDLSVHDDFSAVSYTSYFRPTRTFCVHTEYYFPEGALENHPNKELYRVWHEQGYLKFCEGNVIDVAQIARDIMQKSKKLHIVAIGYDAYKAQDLVNILLTMPGGKGTLQPYRQTLGNYNLPVESFEMLAYSSPPRILFNNNPINVYCLSNCQIIEDTHENKMPVKITHNRKIDGAMTMLMTLGLLNTFKR